MANKRSLDESKFNERAEYSESNTGPTSQTGQQTSQFDLLRQHLQTLDEERKALAEIAKKKLKQSQELVKQNQELKKQNKEVNKQNEQLKKQNEEVNKQNEQLKKQNEEVNKQNEKLTKDLLGVNTELKLLQNSSQSMNKRIKVMGGEKAAMGKKVKTMERDLMTKNNEMKQRDEEITGLKSEMKQKDEEIENLTQKELQVQAVKQNLLEPLSINQQLEHQKLTQEQTQFYDFGPSTSASMSFTNMTQIENVDRNKIVQFFTSPFSFNPGQRNRPFIDLYQQLEYTPQQQHLQPHQQEQPQLHIPQQQQLQPQQQEQEQQEHLQPHLQEQEQQQLQNVYPETETGSSSSAIWTLPPVKKTLTKKELEDIQDGCDFYVSTLSIPKLVTSRQRIIRYDKVYKGSRYMDNESGVYTTPLRGEYRFSGVMGQKGSGKMELYICSKSNQEERRELVVMTDNQRDRCIGNVTLGCVEGEHVSMEVVRIEGEAEVKYCGFNGGLLS